MTKRKSATANREPVPVAAKEGETEPQTLARVYVEPYWRHGFLVKAIADKSVGKLPGDPQFTDFGDAVKAKADCASSGNLKLATEMLVTQAHSLDAMFAEFARRAALNMGDYINAAESYSRMALRAQSNCRATLEALMKLHQPREQVVKHVHVNEGGQAVVADHFHAGGQEDAKSTEQSHATTATGERASLPSPDPQRDGVPIPSGQGEKTLQNARRNEPGSA